MFEQIRSFLGMVKKSNTLRIITVYLFSFYILPINRIDLADFDFHIVFVSADLWMKFFDIYRHTKTFIKKTIYKSDKLNDISLVYLFRSVELLRNIVDAHFAFPSYTNIIINVETPVVYIFKNDIWFSLYFIREEIMIFFFLWKRV